MADKERGDWGSHPTAREKGKGGREGEAIISRESERSIKIFLQSKGLRDDGAAAHEYIFA